jgi:hypothetical protein
MRLLLCVVRGEDKFSFRPRRGISLCAQRVGSPARKGLRSLTGGELCRGRSCRCSCSSRSLVMTLHLLRAGFASGRFSFSSACQPASELLIGDSIANESLSRRWTGAMSGWADGFEEG